MPDIKRGEIYWVNWEKGKRSEQAGIRPSLVIQNDVGNQVSPNTIIASLTTAQKKPFPFLVYITAEESGLDKDSSVDLASLMTISKTRLGDKCGQLSEAKMCEVDEAIKVSLGIN